MFVKCVKDMRIIWAEVHVERKKNPSYQILIIRHDVSRRGAFRLHFKFFFFFFFFLLLSILIVIFDFLFFS